MSPLCLTIMSTATHIVDASKLPIKSVTVYRSNKAQIVRDVTVQLKVGFMAHSSYSVPSLTIVLIIITM